MLMIVKKKKKEAHFLVLLPDSGIPHNVRSASSTAHLSPPFSFRPFYMGCCRQRAAGTGHLSSNAWPPPEKMSER